jgi:hypothetical protein
MLLPRDVSLDARATTDRLGLRASGPTDGLQRLRLQDEPA